VIFGRFWEPRAPSSIQVVGLPRRLRAKRYRIRLPPTANNMKETQEIASL
jgi:hypothetical protein